MKFINFSLSLSGKLKGGQIEPSRPNRERDDGSYYSSFSSLPSNALAAISTTLSTPSCDRPVMFPM